VRRVVGQQAARKLASSLAGGTRRNCSGDVRPQIVSGPGHRIAEICSLPADRSRIDSKQLGAAPGTRSSSRDRARRIAGIERRHVRQRLATHAERMRRRRRECRLGG